METDGNDNLEIIVDDNRRNESGNSVPDEEDVSMGAEIVRSVDGMLSDQFEFPNDSHTSELNVVSSVSSHIVPSGNKQNCHVQKFIMMNARLSRRQGNELKDAFGWIKSREKKFKFNFNPENAMVDMRILNLNVDRKADKYPRCSITFSVFEKEAIVRMAEHIANNSKKGVHWFNLFNIHALAHSPPFLWLAPISKDELYKMILLSTYILTGPPKTLPRTLLDNWTQNDEYLAKAFECENTMNKLRRGLTKDGITRINRIKQEYQTMPEENNCKDDNNNEDKEAFRGMVDI